MNAVETIKQIQNRTDLDAATAAIVQQKQIEKAMKPVSTTDQLYTEIETLALLNKEQKALDTRYESIRLSVIKQMKTLKLKTCKTPANVVATLFKQTRTTLDAKAVAKLLTPKQLKRVSKTSKVETLKVTP